MATINGSLKEITITKMVSSVKENCESIENCLSNNDQTDESCAISNATDNPSPKGSLLENHLNETKISQSIEKMMNGSELIKEPLTDICLNGRSLVKEGDEEKSSFTSQMKEVISENENEKLSMIISNEKSAKRDKENSLDKNIEKVTKAGGSDDIEEVDPLSGPDPLVGDSEVVKALKSLGNNVTVGNCNIEKVNSAKPSEVDSDDVKTKSSEPTLVIIDTNSIMSGKGPIPISSYAGAKKQSPSTVPKNFTSPTQNFFGSEVDDSTFLIEAASFVVPYVLEKPGKELFQVLRKQHDKDESKESSEPNEVDKEKEPVKVNQIDGPSKDKIDKESDDKSNVEKKPSEEYFESSLGKFFCSIGMNLVQEHVQCDLLRMQRRKADREGTKGTFANQQAIKSLQKNLDDSRENNMPFKLKFKKCKFCSFQSESTTVMEHHLEVPHMINNLFLCNFCEFETRNAQEILYHTEAEHNVNAHLEKASAFHQCSNCPFEDNSKSKVTRHRISCDKRFKLEKNQECPLDWDFPGKLLKSGGRGRSNASGAQFSGHNTAGRYHLLMPKPPVNTSIMVPNPNQSRSRGRPVGAYKDSAGNNLTRIPSPGSIRNSAGYLPLSHGSSILYRPSNSSQSILMQGSNNSVYHWMNGQIVPVLGSNFPSGSSSGSSGQPRFSVVPGSSGSASNNSSVALMPALSNKASPTVTLTPAKSNTINLPSSLSIQNVKSGSKISGPKQPQQPSISITPVPRQNASVSIKSVKGGQPGSSKNAFVICEICDGYIKDLEQLRNHMQWIHKVKIHPKMIHNRPPLNCQKCQYRFFTDQGLERHLLGSHGLVTSSMQDNANKGQDSGRCPICGKVYQWKLLNHVSRDHQLVLKPAHLSYKCTVCTATFSMYRLFENHVYSAHSMVAKRVLDAPKKSEGGSNAIKINNEITIIPQPKRADGGDQGKKIIGKQLEKEVEEEFRADDSSKKSNYNIGNLKVSVCKVTKCGTCKKKHPDDDLLACQKNLERGKAGASSGGGEASENSESSSDELCTVIAPAKFQSGEVTIEPVKSARGESQVIDISESPIKPDRCQDGTREHREKEQSSLDEQMESDSESSGLHKKAVDEDVEVSEESDKDVSDSPKPLKRKRNDSQEMTESKRSKSAPSPHSGEGDPSSKDN